MSQANKIFQLLAANPDALKHLLAAFEDLLADETAQANQLAQRALFYPEDKSRACVGVGRCEILRELITRMKRETT